MPLGVYSPPVFTDEQIGKAIDTVEWAERRGVFLKYVDGVLSCYAHGRLDQFTVETLRAWRPIIKYVITETAAASMTKIDFRSFKEYAQALKRRRLPRQPLPPTPPQKELPMSRNSDPNHTPKFKRMTHRDRYFASKLLEANLVPIEGTGFFTYINGYSDSRVREECAAQAEGRTIPLTSVGILRGELFGHIRMPRGPAKSTTQRLLDDIAHLKEENAAIIKAHNAFIERLATKVALGEGWPALKIYQ